MKERLQLARTKLREMKIKTGFYRQDVFVENGVRYGGYRNFFGFGKRVPGMFFGGGQMEDAGRNERAILLSIVNPDILTNFAPEHRNGVRLRYLEMIANGQLGFYHVDIEQEVIPALLKAAKVDYLRNAATAAIGRLVSYERLVDMLSEAKETEERANGTVEAFANRIRELTDELSGVMEDVGVFESTYILSSDIPTRIRMLATGTRAQVLAMLDKKLIPDPSVPQAFLNYRCIRHVESGGMGSVYTAEHPDFGTVIIKTTSLKSPEHIRRFAREAEVLERIRHPNIMRVYEHNLDNDPIFYSGEYIRGMSLREFMSRNGPIPIEQALTIAYHIVLGLEAASDEINGYANGIVHRDMKPENVMLTFEGSLVKIIDFGLVKDAADGAELTTKGMIMGTPAYLAPEIYRVGAKGLDHRADIFALSIMMYEMITGLMPFDPRTNNNRELMFRHMEFATNENHPLSDGIVDDIEDARLRNLLIRGCEKDPDRRYDSFGQIKKEIAAILS